MSASGTPAVTPERILQMMWGYAPPMILATATKLGLFDALDQGPQTAAEVARRTKTSERGVRPVLNALVGLQFLGKSGKDQYKLTPEAAAFLVSSKPGYLGAVVQQVGRELIPQWLALPDTVQSGRPARGVNQEEGAKFFESLVVGLFPLNLPPAQALGKALNVASAAKPLKILDIAAGSGVWGIGIAQNAPGSSVTAVDWPNVLEVTKRYAAEQGLAERFSYIDGDMNTVDFGTGYDLAVLGHILHSDGEKNSRALLKKVAKALVPGGTIAIAEYLVNEDRTGPPMGLFFAINMLVNTDAGDTYSFEEIRQWLAEAGFTNPRKIEPGGPASVIVAQKA
ncbi:MAG TPA: methyltransferase [Bryobacteraceae bacterium]|jgi:ubiquinone/menaquinone biosynthesis C-methylase UbiE|nr:methyltransferase [Bryobacteraceae bacterium]